MTVWELIGMLAQCKPDDTVAIPVVTGHVTIGRSPNLEVDSLRKGFDWDDGMVFLQVSDDNLLTPMSKEEYSEHIRYKQLVSGMRGKADIDHLSDRYIRKDFVLDRLKRLINVEELEPFEVADLIHDIKEEKL